MQRQWRDVEGLVNLRDVGGLPIRDGGRVAPGRLLRSDNLQTLTEDGVDALLALGVTDVVDLRSDYEAEAEGPGPLTKRDQVTISQHSLFREWRAGVGEDKADVRPEVMPEEALPWVDLEPQVELENVTASVYFSYLLDRPDSVLAALRTVAGAPGATLVHCAAGKDRTGTIVALALTLVGVDRSAVVADYAASTERAAAIVDKLRRSPTYAENLRGRPLSSHYSYPETMEAFLGHLEQAQGGVRTVLDRMGWTEADQQRLQVKLRE